MSICWNHPNTFEAVGGLSSLAADTIAKIGSLLGQCLGLPPQEPTRHLFQRLSLSLWQGNAALWIRLAPFLPLSWVGFHDSFFGYFYFFNFLFCFVCVYVFIFVFHVSPCSVCVLAFFFFSFFFFFFLFMDHFFCCCILLYYHKP